MSNLHLLDSQLVSLLAQLSQDNPDYWSFNGKSEREYTHNFFQYPAMMVPQMQGELINSILRVNPGVKRVFDPFAGSGTIMTEAMLKGLDFKGFDINPLAILLCRSKSEHLNIDILNSKIDELLQIIDNDYNDSIAITFPGLNKWFRRDIAIELSHIRNAILVEDELGCRRFFWVALAETVRLVSNSRTSNFKLYVRTPEDISSRQISAIEIFKRILRENLKRLDQYRNCLQEKNLLHNDQYTGEVLVRLADTSQTSPTEFEKEAYDLLVTSPPYGDNKTTVTYGQYSYLPLQWIKLDDIDETATRDYLQTTHEIDTRSLGGKLANSLIETETLALQSASFARISYELRDEPSDRLQRVAAFCRDLNKALDAILPFLRPEAYMVWTVANRRVANREVPTDKILEELLLQRGAYLVTKIRRTFPSNSKRMANLSDTMAYENILIMRKAR